MYLNSAERKARQDKISNNIAILVVASIAIVSWIVIGVTVYSRLW